MNSKPSTSKQNVFDDEEVFEDSSIMANFNYSSFKESSARLSESNLDNSHNISELNVSALCCDEEMRGYDKLTGQTWIYPTNYPVRDYQFNIIKAAILNNTLVSLPTGLGKTFIAAVIMYNFYRWYPLGKIVFTAPTRPLVAQQIEACYNIVAIPPNDTVEMTGHMQVTARKAHWQSKRVFFATPQVIYNDIKSGICPGEKIRCLIIDEAHRARGNYAYCQIVSTLTDMSHKTYRVLALSATPGSKVDDVVNVVRNLHIAHLELRTECCMDVAPYSHVKKINTVIVQLGPELTQLRHHYVEIMDGYARRLKQLNILPHNLGNLSKGRVVMLYKEFHSRDRANRHPQHNYIMKDFTLLIALYHGLELLVKHGSRVFLNFFDDHPEKSWIQSDDQLTALLERLRDDLGVNPLSLDRSILPDGTIPEVPNNLSFGHPKFYQLKEIMLEHFNKAKQNGQDTRAIVFCEYRESVNLVHCLLLQCRPLIVAQMFVGQGASGKDGKTIISQKQQLRVMRNFREGVCNTLVATCVAEEGLDVGSVDLIICFDISTRSPIRLVQRCGRTGRERGGQVYILVTEGREHQTLTECMRQRDGLNKKIQQSREVQSALYAHNPRMMPRDHAPRCQKMYITVAPKADTGDKSRKNQKDLRTMLLSKTSSSSSNNSNKEVEANVISEKEFQDIFPDGFPTTNFFEEPKEYWSKSKETIMKDVVKEQQHHKLSTWLEWQRTLQITVNVGHSKDTEILAALLQISDAKRLEMPASTQSPCFYTQDFAIQSAGTSSPRKPLIPTKVVTPSKTLSPAKSKHPKKKQKIPIIKSPGKKDGDIRSLFSTATKSTKNYTKWINDLGLPDDGSIPTRLINLFVDLSMGNTNASQKCYICDNICDCSFIKNIRKYKKKPPFLMTFLSQPKLPDIDLIDDMNSELILKCAKADHSNDLGTLDVTNRNDSFNDVEKKCNKNFDLEFDLESPFDLTLQECNIEDQKPLDTYENNFDIGEIEDIFADSSTEEKIVQEVVKVKDKNTSDPKQALEFFGLDSIDDIFADSDDNEVVVCPLTPPKRNQVDCIKNDTATNIKGKPDENPISPSILSGRVNTNISTSPILCSQVRKFCLSTKKHNNRPHTSTLGSNVKRQLIPDPARVTTPIEKEQTKSNKLQGSLNTTNKSMFTITQLVDMINKTDSNVNKKISLIDDERSSSPILSTQADKKKSMHNSTSISSIIMTQNVKKAESLIILESSSDSENETQIYEFDEKNNKVIFFDIDLNIIPSKNNSNLDGNQNKISHFTPATNKRKFQVEDDKISTASPYFYNNKKQKPNNDVRKKLTLQEKVLAALSTKNSNNRFNNDTNVNFIISPNKLPSRKENLSPTDVNSFKTKIDEDKEHSKKKNIGMLQMFRRDSPIHKFNEFLNSSRTQLSNKRKLNFEDSDDDFIDAKSQQSPHQKKSTTRHKVRKKKWQRLGNEFLDLEAEQSDCDSGDELTDDSAGSIVDFICDDKVSLNDMHAIYARSVKSPVKGMFKIPQLPKKYNKEEIFSQFVEEDTYEMDSFCVDSHIGLTQVNDVSELELAEILLEERKAKKKSKPAIHSSPEEDERPALKRKNKNARRIHSDSDESS